MEKWKVAIIILCLYGFFKELRPSEAFLTPYLKSNFKNLTENEVDNQIYPIWTYTNMVALVIVLLVTDLLHHNPVIIFEGVSYIVTWALLIWGEGVFTMQMMQFVYGFATATEIAYQSYIYLMVSVDKYKKLTGMNRAALLCGRSGAGLIGQVVISTKAMNYLQLNYISMSCVLVAFLLSLALPCAHKVQRVKREVDEAQRSRRSTTASDEVDHTIVAPDQNIQQFARNGTRTTCCCFVEDRPTADEITVEDQNRCKRSCSRCWKRCKFEIRSLFVDLIKCYRTPGMLKWSLWWAFAMCGFLQVGNYGQNLWDTISPSRQNEKIYNGAVEAITTLLGAGMAFGIGFIPADWEKYGELLLFVVSALDTVCLLIMSQTTSIWLAYGLYLIFRACYQPGITAASFQIATYMTTERHGLIFGFNTFMALVLDTLITAIVVDKSALNTPVRLQFVIYGGYFAVIAFIFLVAAIMGAVRRYRQSHLDQEGEDIL